jgi:hypothetical protein
MLAVGQATTLTDPPPQDWEEVGWIYRFGAVDKHQTEDYGKLLSMRVWY